MSTEAGEFNAKEFIEKYNISFSDSGFDTLLLAEEASQGGRFSKANAKLVLQLVSRGGTGDMFLLAGAIRASYKNWKDGTDHKFSLCDYAFNRFSINFCARLDNKNDEQEMSIKLDNFEQKLDKTGRLLLKEAYRAASNFIDSKAENEEMYNGSERFVWMSTSQHKHKREFFDLTNKVYEGFKPSVQYKWEIADRNLNTTYKKVMAVIKDKSEELPEYEGLQKTQRYWIVYRDITAQLFATLNPSVNIESWKTWLTEMREEELRCIIHDPTATCRSGEDLLLNDKLRIWK